MSKRFLTKSRFKVGYECPTKLVYLDDDSYGSTKCDNPFLQALAEGGFQVGELAKIYHPGGIEIAAADLEEAALETAELLKKKNVTIFEAAIKFKNFYVKIDILNKKGNAVELVEVKAKSYDPDSGNGFYAKRSLKNGDAQIKSEWEPYLVDVAFQKYVFAKAYPDLKIKSFLMLADKSAVATVDGLNQRFLIERLENGRTRIKVAKGTTLKTVGKPILRKINVDKEVDLVWKMTFDDEMSFEELADHLSQVCAGKITPEPCVGSQCKSCEFRIDDDMRANGLKSGFERCWMKARGLRQKDFEKPFVFDIWNFRRSANLIEAGKIFMDQVTEEDVGVKEDPEREGLTWSQRQWIQVQKAKKKGLEPYFDAEGIKKEMASWKFPLHFIDFETTRVAIPFHKSRRPYENIAFQFSHHRVDKNRKVTHATQYLSLERGRFPNFDFVRALRDALSNDSGTIFRYSNHENTVLVDIRKQLLETDKRSVPDRQELIKFIESITKPTGSVEDKWHGERCMVDLRDVVLGFFYHPLTHGSNSIKDVLPAILSTSKELQERYSQPIYGTRAFPSQNYSNWAWIKKDESGEIIDPYELLPSIFTDVEMREMTSLYPEEKVDDGGAAMTAYARMQFTEMADAERERVAEALLKYCELDTFAMVLIYEYFKIEIEKRARKAA